MPVMFSVNIFVPIIAGIVYFMMAKEVRHVGQIRKLIFGEIGYKKVYIMFNMLGIYFITRPLQNIIGPHPWPMIINDLRQFFLMAVIAPSVLVGILLWDSGEEKVSRSIEVSAYLVGIITAIIFVLSNSIAINGSKVIVEYLGMRLYDAVWFEMAERNKALLLIHLFSQLISPVGFFVLAAGIVRSRRHNYPTDSVYNQMPLKWKYLEYGLIFFAASMIFAGISALLGKYYTYLWVIYFVGAIIAAALELRSVKIHPSSAPKDLQ